ncbi:muts domain V-domain-containing protein [Coniochaeta sp. 2T2.1]|nr:muts domain V-domain-containing protein [Coniochaeta sp. 2T2.1]
MSSIPGSRHDEPPPEEDLDDNDALNEIIMAIEMKDNNTIGCAYYVAMEETLFLQEDIPMAGTEIVETLLLQAQPTTVINNNRAPEKMAKYLEAHAQDLDGIPGGVNGVYILRTVGASDFNPNNGQQKLAGLDASIFGGQSTVLTAVTEEIGDDGMGEMRMTTQSKLMRLATLINLNSRLSIGCAGAVLSELHRRRVVEFLPDDPAVDLAFCVKRITMFNLGDSMFVNADTLISLQILGSEHHPNSQMQGPDKSKQGAKEDLSVYGLVKTLACTPQGKARLRQMFLRPSNDLDLIRERYRSIAAFLRPENRAVLEQITKKLSKVKDIKGTIANLNKGVHQATRAQGVKNGVWLTLGRFTRAALELCGMIHEMAGNQPLNIVSKASNIMTGTDARVLRDVGEMISQNIDFDKSVEAQRTTIKWGIDPELDELKHFFAGLEDVLAAVRVRVLQVMPDWAREYLHNCIFYPQLGFLVSISENPETKKGFYRGEGIPGDDWVMMFTTEGVVMYKTTMMKDLDATYGDPYGRIVDREIEVVHQLGVGVLEHSETLTTASELFGELDSLIALAMAAEKYKWTAPKMTMANTIDIKEGRHPLQELVVPSFIANPCHISGGRDTGVHGDVQPPPSHQPEHDQDDDQPAPSMLILTGPNHSGKSVYVKQAALIVYLAHVGSYVPADRATIGLTDKILTRISTRESMARSESAFAIDLRQAAFSINHTTRRSLILIDEFGKGTNATDGAGLMTALLDHFLHLASESPKVLVATHFHEIFEHGFLTADDDDRLSFAHMEVRLDLQTEEQVTYLFRLVPGRSTSSYGCRCAAMNGVDVAVVERAEALALLLARNEDLQAACAKLAPAEERRLEEAEGVARRFLEMDVPVVTGRSGEREVRSMLGVVLGRRGGES